MKTIAARCLACRVAWGALLVPCAAAPACRHDWDKYDPLLGSATSAASSGSGGSGGAASASSTSTTSSATTSSSSGGGGAACTTDAGVEDCTALCDGDVSDHCGAWSVSFHGVKPQQGAALAVTPDAALLAVAGLDDGIALFPDVALTTETSVGNRTFVAAFQPTPTGVTRLWGHDFDNYAEHAWSVAIDPSNNVIVAGDYRYTINPCPPTTTKLTDTGNGDMFVVKYDAQGNCRFARSFGAAAGLDGANAVAADTASIYVGGYYHGQVDFGDGTLTAAANATGAVVMKLQDHGDGTTGTLWKVTWDSVNGDEVNAVALDATSGSVIAGGFYSYTLTLAGKKLVSNHYLLSGIVAKISDTDGAVTWSQGFTAPGAQPSGTASVTSVALDPGSRDVLAAGTFGGTVDFTGVTAAAAADAGAPDPGCVLHSMGAAQDIFVVRLAAADGHCIWASRYGRDSTATTPTPRIAINAAGCLAATGTPCIIVGATATDSIYLGNWPALAAQGDDAMLFALDLGGAPVWARLFGDVNNQELGALAVDGSGATYITGSFEGKMSFSPSSMLQVTMTTTDPDAFLAKITP